MLRRMQEAAECMDGLLYEEEKPKLLRLEGLTGIVEEISKDKASGKVRELTVRLKSGECWNFSPRFVLKGICNRTTSATPEEKDRCTHVSKPGTFTVAIKTPLRCHLQCDLSSARLVCDPKKLRKLAPNPDEVDKKIRTTIWREYQQEAIEELLRRRRAVCFLRPGGGKTVIALGAFLRMKFDPKCAVRLLPGDVFLVLTEANLVEEVWAKQAYEHGVFEHLHVAKGKEKPDSCKQLVVVSIQYLSSHLMRSNVFNERACTLWDRRVSAVFVDEVHRLGGTQVWNSAVTKLSGSAAVAVGLTGTFFPNNPTNAAHISAAMGLHEDLCREEFWQQPMALQLAAGTRYRCIYRPAEEATRVGAPARERNPPWRRVSYTACPERCPGKPVVNSICECLDIGPTKAKEFHELADAAEKSRCFDNNDFSPSSKISALMASVERLFMENRHKIFVTVLYLDVLLIVTKFLARRYPQGEGCRVMLFEYHGKLTTRERKSQLDGFLDRDCSWATRSIMVFSLCAGRTGLNITRGEKSPKAHIEFEQAHLASDRFQVQCRVDRDGNPHTVQLVALEGTNTEESRKMGRQWMQARKQKAAGCDDMLKALFEEEVSAGEDAEKMSK